MQHHTSPEQLDALQGVGGAAISEAEPVHVKLDSIAVEEAHEHVNTTPESITAREESSPLAREESSPLALQRGAESPAVVESAEGAVVPRGGGDDSLMPVGELDETP